MNKKTRKFVSVLENQEDNDEVVIEKISDDTYVVVLTADINLAKKKINDVSFKKLFEDFANFSSSEESHKEK